MLLSWFFMLLSRFLCFCMRLCRLFMLLFRFLCFCLGFYAFV